MSRHTFLWVLLFTLVAVAVGIFLPGRTIDKQNNRPWQIERVGDTSRVFGIELGKTTLSEVERLIREPAEVSLFNREGRRIVEAYFDNVDFSGLRARIVLVMDLSKAELDTMFDRGARIAKLGSGANKVTLADKDLLKVGSTPVVSITYIPRINLDAAIIEKRFGKPTQRIREKEGVIEHWLYAEKGLDVALDPEGKEVLQYVSPSRFIDSLLQPLEAKERSESF